MGSRGGWGRGGGGRRGKAQGNSKREMRSFQVSPRDEMKGGEEGRGTNWGAGGWMRGSRARRCKSKQNPREVLGAGTIQSERLRERE